MKLYYHHVGKKGANEDFKKTVFSRVPISMVEQTVSDDEPNKSKLVSELYRNFPNGSFNCWGVPNGAARVIKNLQVGDAVLLIEDASLLGGNIPALCVIKVFLRQEFLSLSYALWGSSHFPFIFFFDTIPLDLSWVDFKSDVGYSENYSPQGYFLAVADNKLDSLGGAEKYVKYLSSKLSDQPVSFYQAKEYLHRNIQEESPDYQRVAQEELEKILASTTSNTPALTDDLSSEPVQVNISPRDAAFSSQIKLIYGERCAVCGSNRHTPNGNPEVECAHIYPKSLNGRDIPQNGISLCKMHHWAFDCGWFSIADDLTIVVNSKTPRTHHYTFITDFEGKSIAVPENTNDCPHPVFLSAHRKLHGFE